MALRWVSLADVEFDERDLEAIVASALQIARKVPWMIDGPREFMDGLAASGFAVSGQEVRLNDRLIDATMDAISLERDRNPPNARGRTPGPVCKTATGQAGLCCDPATGNLRDSTIDDLARFSRLVDAVPGLERGHPTFIPQDVPNATRDLHALVTVMANSAKPSLVSAYSPEIIPYFVEAFAIYYGSREEGIRKLIRPCRVYINTPFRISGETLQAALVLEELTGLRPQYFQMPVLGAATPVTSAGALALSLAEAIGANAVSLAMHGQLCGWATSPTELDLKSAIYTQWGPGCLLFSLGASLLRCHVFGGDFSFSAGATTAAKVPDVQSVMETTFNLSFAFALGCRSFGSLATLAFADVGSPVQLLLELELISALEATAAGFEINEDTLATNVSIEVAPGGARFIESEHTLRHYRQCQWYPEFMDRQPPFAWMGNPTSMLEKARDKAQSLWNSSPNLCPLSNSQLNELGSLLATADRLLG